MRSETFTTILVHVFPGDDISSTIDRVATVHFFRVWNLHWADRRAERRTRRV